MRTSKSIEKKRLVFIDRAMRHLQQAPAEERRKFLEGLSRTEALGYLVGDLKLGRREWGPTPDPRLEGRRDPTLLAMLARVLGALRG